MNKNLLLKLLIGLVFLGGCLKFGDNYSYKDGQPPPIPVIEQWIGAPLPSNYTDLKYEIIGDSPDKRVAIAVKVPERFYRNVIKNLVIDDTIKSETSFVSRNYETSPDAFMKPAKATTTVWTSKEGFYRKYVWYQDSTLYISYSEN